MKMKRFLVFGAAIAMLVLVALACNFSASTANISNAHMSLDEFDSQSVAAYALDAQTFYCYFDLNNAPDDTVVKGVWTLVSADGFDSNQEIDSAEITGGDNTYYFSLDRASDPWPVGQYKIDLYLNDQLVQTVNFEVK